ncbi:hypothetical protein D1Y84_09415 [Acidipila sp. EB88]|nr:hypothetical protein D1Y84_09415 [Acidipila sp. EB88]
MEQQRVTCRMFWQAVFREGRRDASSSRMAQGAGLQQLPLPGFGEVSMDRRCYGRGRVWSSQAYAA